MNKPTSILAVTARDAADSALLAKAVRLARQFGAGLEIFGCDAEHAYELKHAYESSGVADALRACAVQLRDYLAGLKAEAHAADVRIAIDAACESPLCEGILHKILNSRPDLVMKNAGGVDRRGRAAFDANDWQLMRSSPVTLLVSRGRAWGTPSRFAAAIDVSEEETAGLADAIVETATCLAAANAGDLELVYAERAGLSEAVREKRASRLRQLAQRSNVDPAHVRTLLGEPEEALQTFARARDYDAIVIGALTHRAGLATLVGTLTSKLLDALDSDLVLVRPGTQVAFEERKPGVQ